MKDEYVINPEPVVDVSADPFDTLADAPPHMPKHMRGMRKPQARTSARNAWTAEREGHYYSQDSAGRVRAPAARGLEMTPTGETYVDKVTGLTYDVMEHVVPMEGDFRVKPSAMRRKFESLMYGGAPPRLAVKRQEWEEDEQVEGQEGSDQVRVEKERRWGRAVAARIAMMAEKRDAHAWEDEDGYAQTQELPVPAHTLPRFGPRPAALHSGLSAKGITAKPHMFEAGRTRPDELTRQFARRTDLQYDLGRVVLQLAEGMEGPHTTRYAELTRLPKEELAAMARAVGYHFLELGVFARPDSDAAPRDHDSIIRAVGLRALELTNVAADVRPTDAPHLKAERFLLADAVGRTLLAMRSLSSEHEAAVRPSGQTVERDAKADPPLALTRLVLDLIESAARDGGEADREHVDRTKLAVASSRNLSQALEVVVRSAVQLEQSRRASDRGRHTVDMWAKPEAAEGMGQIGRFETTDRKEHRAAAHYVASRPMENANRDWAFMSKHDAEYSAADRVRTQYDARGARLRNAEMELPDRGARKYR